MLNQSRLKEAVDAYKKDFTQKRWQEEKYKWKAVHCFQTHWNIKAKDFLQMLTDSLSQTENLLVSAHNFPAEMIIRFAKEAPEEVRSMYITLFDETQDLYARIANFKQKSDGLLERFGNGVQKHYQYENAISTYLWLRYPDKYYIYKFSEINTVSKLLESGYQFKKGAYVKNFQNFMSLYDEICEALKQDSELRDLLTANLTESDYSDPCLHTLTMDVCFYISRFWGNRVDGIRGTDSKTWLPAEYTPNLTAGDWAVLLQNDEIFTKNSLEIMKRIQDFGGQATCKQLSEKYGETINFYNVASVTLAKRVAKETGCPLYMEKGDVRYWPVLYLGKPADGKEEGSFVYKIRKELKEALRQTDLSKIDLYAGDREQESRRYWFLNSKPQIWSFSDMLVGKVVGYTLYNDNGNKRRIFQNFLDARTGDLVIGYESTPRKQITGLAQVVLEQDKEQIYFEKTEELSVPIDFAALKSHPKLKHMEFFKNFQGTLFKLTKEEYDIILDMIREENPKPALPVAFSNYTKEDFLEEVYMTEAKYNRLASVLLRKKNLILQGAPGVGKTFAAKRLAYSIMGKKDDSRIAFVQFHQNYSYEDFMMGYKPVKDGFELKYGIFYRFCKKAANYPEQDYFFIIDEINRGNLSRIFGELLMLIENDYRNEPVELAYNGELFAVPKNLYIIGLMNTADKSLAMMDYALRLRFSFFEMEPGFDTDGFLAYQSKVENGQFDQLIGQIKELNGQIAEDKSLGKGFCIGHSYFCNASTCTEEWLRDVVEFDILPLIREYWFDDETAQKQWENRLQGVFQ